MSPISVSRKSALLPISAAISAMGNMSTQAAASKMPSGIPPVNRKISASASRSSVSITKPGFDRLAASRNSWAPLACIASSG